VGVVTNGVALGWDHEDLLTIEVPYLYFSNRTLIITLLAVTLVIIIGIGLYRLCRKRYQRLALEKLKQRAIELANQA
jgi:hypothetical protein